MALPTDTRACADCRTAPHQLTACFAAVDYTYPWQRLVHRFKFANEPAWATWFAELLWQQPSLPQAVCACDWWLPIPLTPLRLGERGYNQAWELAHALARHVPHHLPHLAPTDAPGQVRPAATLRHDVLMKVADTAAQHNLTRSERQANLRAAFAVQPKAANALVGKTVLLVDDVMTTGATLRAAARTLLHAGAASVSAVVFARTPAPEAYSAE